MINIQRMHADLPLLPLSYQVANYAGRRYISKVVMRRAGDARGVMRHMRKRLENET